MKRLIALCLLFAATLATPAHADPVDLRLRSPGGEMIPEIFRSELQHKADHMIVLRNAGIVTTIIGTIATGIGAGLVASNICLSDSGQCDGRTDGGVNAGIGLFAVGQAAVLAGIPMWVVGGTRLKSLRTQLSLTAGGVVGRF